MPWLSIAMALLTYLLLPTGSATQRRNALLGALAVGGATFATTHYTDWGQENLGQFDGVIPETVGPPAPGTGYIAPPGQQGGSLPSGWAGLWSTLQSWGAAGTAAVLGTGIVATSGQAKWLLYGGLALGAYLLFFRN